MLPLLCLLAAAVIFSTAGIAIKASTLGAWEIVFGRSAIAAATFVLVLPAARRGWSPRIVLAAVPFAATMTLFVLATRLTTAANAIILQSTAPLHLLVLSPWLLGEPVRRRDLGFLTVMLAGIVLVTLDAPADAADAPARRVGDLVALASGVAWALTLVGLRGLTRDDPSPPVAMLAVGNLLTAAVSLPATLPLAVPAARDASILLYLGLVQIPVAYLLLARGMRAVPALPASLLMLLEPVLNPLWVWLFHGERPGPVALVGGGFVLAATAIRTVQAARR